MEILVLGSQNTKWFKVMSVCILCKLLVCNRPTDSAKATHPILFKFSQNFHFKLKYVQKVIYKINSVLAKILNFYKICIVYF